MRRHFVPLVLILAGLAAEVQGQGASRPTPQPDHLIGAEGIGPLRLGMTLDDAQRSLPLATFQRASDGDGAALVQVKFRGGESLYLWAGEDDPDLPIDRAKRIRTIETFDRAFETIEGIRVGTLLVAAERVWGAVNEIVESEIESRQFVTFERQPPGLSIRNDYSGVFTAGTRRTTRYRADAQIMSIAVSSD